jgi:hypothetical protein
MAEHENLLGSSAYTTLGTTGLFPPFGNCRKALPNMGIKRIDLSVFNELRMANSLHNSGGVKKRCLTLWCVASFRVD